MVEKKVKNLANGGEGGIRTLGPPQRGQRFSRPPRSTAPAPLHPNGGKGLAQVVKEHQSNRNRLGSSLDRACVQSRIAARTPARLLAPERGQEMQGRTGPPTGHAIAPRRKGALPCLESPKRDIPPGRNLRRSRRGLIPEK